MIQSSERLETIVLSNQYLTRISDEINEFEELTVIILDNNKIRDFIVLRLKMLKLNHNEIEEIKGNDLKNIESLGILQLNNNRIQKLPNILNKLKNLKHLVLNNSKIRDLQESLSNLHFLSLSSN